MQFYHCGHVYRILPIALLCAVDLNRSDGNEVVNAFKLQYTPLKTSKSFEILGINIMLSCAEISLLGLDSEYYVRYCLYC